MGPRSADRGNGDGAARRGVYLCASMGPRSADRGNPLRGDVLRPVLELQWGRDQLIAEMRTGLAFPDEVNLLQWGRDQLIAEMKLVIACPALLSAASMGPRSADRGNS